MARYGDWLKENIGGLVVAVIGVGGAYLGAHYGASTQRDLWRREKIFSFNEKILEKRLGIIESVVKSNVEAQRAALLWKVADIDKSSLQVIVTACQKNPADSSCVKEFKGLTDSPDLIKEMADMQGRYFANLTLAKIYFCEKTRSSIASIAKSKQDWWAIESSKRDDVVSAMMAELNCGTTFQAALE